MIHRNSSLCIERLEARLVLSAELSGGLLSVLGTDGDDVIRVRSAAGELHVIVNGDTGSFVVGDVTELQISSMGGNDRIVVTPSVLVNATVDGGAGDDLIRGGSGDDLIAGGPGRDRMRGRDGQDELRGDDRRDSLFGDAGDDSLFGGRGGDSLEGGGDDDLIDGQGGSDALRGSEGQDDFFDDDEDNVEDRDDSDFDDGVHDLTNEFELQARLTGSAGAIGRAKYEEEQESAGLKREFEVRVENATPNTNFDVLVDQVLIGQVTTDLRGRGVLELSTQPDDEREQPFPAEFPGITAGSTVAIDAILQGTLAAEHAERDDETGDGVVAILAGSTAAQGVASFEVEAEDDGTELEFELEVTRLPAAQNFDVVVGGVTIGQVTSDSFGRARLKFSTDPDVDERSFPDDFPTIESGVSIAIGTLLTGVFGGATGS